MIIIGADHAGWKLKEKIKNYLVKCNYNIVDVGTFCFDENDDFSKYVLNIKSAFEENKDAKIIAFCGSGIGMNIGLNKIKGVRCVVGHSVQEVEKARQHNDVNALAMGGRTTSVLKAKKMADVFLSTEFLGGKYQKRMKQVEII